MARVLDEVPWENLWRTAVSTALFVVLIGMPLAIFTALDEPPTASLFKILLLVVAAVLAAIVVWSDTVPWIGDS